MEQAIKEIQSLIESTEQLKNDYNQNSVDYVMLMSKELAYYECLNIIKSNSL